MSDGDALDVIRNAIWVSLLIASPSIVAAMTIGLTIALFQALTQIQEMTLTFIPKIVGILIAIYIAAPYMGALLNAITSEMFRLIERGFNST